ncbi:MAG: relaxase/mobilization nuclease domain-containing protein [bacterium]|nr:relaxase/mobilization nuclease domain-containing protein [bacterium]
MNPKKTDGGILVSTYACSPETAADEFMLFRQEYQQNTGRTQENEVIGYHVRQAFKPDEITPEEANEIGKELASRMTDDQFVYVVATHIDKHHIQYGICKGGSSPSSSYCSPISPAHTQKSSHDGGRTSAIMTAFL